jgi:hypothetical protein
MSEIRTSSVRSLARHFFHGATTGETPESGGGAPSNRSCRGRFCPALLLPGGLFDSLRLVSFKGAPDEPGTPGRNPEWGEEEFDGNGSSLASFRAAADEPQRTMQATLGLGLAKGKPVCLRAWARSAADPAAWERRSRRGDWPGK